MRYFPLFLLVVLLGCTQSEPTEETLQFPEVVTLGDERPATLTLPAGIEDMGPVPLIIGLHGYTSNSGELDGYFGLSDRVGRGYALLLPDGMVDTEGDTHWNATDWCCAFRADPPADDVAYLSGLVEEARGHVEISEVIAFGHSNGGFMAYRLACEEAADIRTVVSLAGGSFDDLTHCDGAAPVSVLQVHGDADEVVVYGPNEKHSGAIEEVELWAQRAGCGPAEDAGTADLDAGLEGEETSRTAYPGCDGGHRVEVWTIHGGRHIPNFSPPLAEPVLDWLGIGAASAPLDTE